MSYALKAINQYIYKIVICDIIKSYVPYLGNGKIQLSVKIVICDSKMSYAFKVINLHIYKIVICDIKNVICSSMSHVQKMLYIKGNLSYPHKTKSSNINIQISTNSVHFLLNFITKCIVGNRNNISASNKAVTNILPLFP